MPLRRDEIEHWLSRFEAADRIDRAAREQHGPRPEWSFRIALSLIAAARAAGAGRIVTDARRSEEENAVREIWARLRSTNLS